MKKLSYRTGLILLVQLSLTHGSYAQVAASTSASTIEFNRAFLHALPGQDPVDLTFFSQENSALPGHYLVDIYLNQTYLEQAEIRIEQRTDKLPNTKNTAPCITTSLLQRWQVDFTQLPSIPLSDQACVNIEQLIPYSRINFNVSQQKLEVSLPQTILIRQKQGEVDPRMWDTGITAGLLNYHLVASRSHTATQTNANNIGLNLQGGVNFDAWRLRYRGYYQNQNSQSSWQTSNLNLSRDLPSWRSRLMVGETFTSANILEGVSLRGIQLTSADDMLADSLRNYAPTLQGIAQSQAQVSVKQNGYVIYKTFVAPGPFLIDDLSPLLSSGELEMVITEADGRTTISRQYFSVAPIQIRTGNLRYELAAGEYRNTRSVYKPKVAQATLIYGVNNSLSAYGGLRLSKDYQSAVLGAGLNLQQYGASSLDLTHTAATLPTLGNTAAKGQALRWQYTKSFPKAETYLQLTLNQYLASFYSFAEASDSPPSLNSSSRLCTRLDSSVMQNLGKNYGRVNVTLSISRYQDGKNLRDLRFGYSNQYKSVSYNLDYTHSKTLDTNTVTGNRHQLSLSFSLPLERKNTQASPTWFNYNVTTDSEGTTNHYASVSGSLLEENKLTYSAGINQSKRDGSNGFASFNLQTKLAQISLGHTQGQNYNNSHASISGGAIVHAGGLTLSQPLSDTVILAKIPDTPAVGFENHASVVTDSHGYAVIPSATPYRRNNLALKTEDLADNIEIENTIAQPAPTRGAVVLAEYAAKKGYKLLLTVSLADGRSLPFGAYVNNQAGEQISMVGANSQIFLSGIAPSDNFTIRWGNDQQQSCRLLSPLLKVAGNNIHLIQISNKLFEGKVQCS